MTTRKQVDGMEFIKVWQKADSAEAVAIHFQRKNKDGSANAQWARIKAMNLRAHDVELKKFPRKAKIDYKALNTLAKSLVK